jgi:hypothetical protein
VSPSQPNDLGRIAYPLVCLWPEKKKFFHFPIFSLFGVEFFVVSGVFSDAKRNNDCVSRCTAAAAGAEGKEGFHINNTPFGWSSEARKREVFFQLGYSTFGVFLGWESNYYFFLLLLITYGCGLWRRFATSFSFQFLSLLSVVLLGSSL